MNNDDITVGAHTSFENGKKVKYVCRVNGTWAREAIMETKVCSRKALGNNSGVL